MMPKRPPTVPVVVDSHKDYSTFQMTRCSYLSIECPEPLTDWILDLSSRQMPFLLLGLQGVIYQPLAAEPGAQFSHADQIEELFRVLEAAGLDVIVNEIWIPNFAFPFQPKAGAVFRVLAKLFAEAAAFHDGRRDRETLARLFEEVREGVAFSEEESRSIADWWARQRTQAIEGFPKNDNLQLPWRELDEEGPPA